MPRLLILVVLALALLLLPAVARAQSPDEGTCRSAAESRAACVGLGKLGERVSAECRRLGRLDDERCHSRIGRKVVRQEIAAYERSWTHRTLAFQQRLGDTLPMTDAPWVGTHNSYNTTSEEPTLSHTDSNQQLSVVDQLRLDVRSLELDVHWVPSHRANGGSAAVLCHGQDNVGCTTERLLRDHLVEIDAWLSANPDEVVLLYLEDQIGGDANRYRTVVDVIDKAIGPRIFRPQGAGCARLPVGLTRAAVRAAGKQVVVVSGCGQGNWGNVAHDWPSGANGIRHEGRPPKAFSVSDCGGISRLTYDQRIVRFFEDSTFVAPAAERTGFSSTDHGLTPETTRAMVRCGVDLFGFDQLLPHDGRLDALVWSWADGEPKAGAGDCTVQDGGRWRAVPCDSPHRPACRDGNGTWRVLPTPVRRAQAHGACAAERSRLDTPRTGWDNGNLADLGTTGGVWLAHRTTDPSPRPAGRRPAARRR